MSVLFIVSVNVVYCGSQCQCYQLGSTNQLCCLVHVCVVYSYSPVSVVYSDSVHCLLL